MAHLISAVSVVTPTTSPQQKKRRSLWDVTWSRRLTLNHRVALRPMMNRCMMPQSCPVLYLRNTNTIWTLIKWVGTLFYRHSSRILFYTPPHSEMHTGVTIVQSLLLLHALLSHDNSKSHYSLAYIFSMYDIDVRIFGKQDAPPPPQ